MLKYQVELTMKITAIMNHFNRSFFAFFIFSVTAFIFVNAGQLEEVEGVLVKSGDDTLEVNAAEIAGRSIRVAQGKLKINQTSITSAK
jgi:hypothetical protein